MLVATDVCLCEYTDHGHCGIMSQRVANDPTVEQLVRRPFPHAAAGADIVAPSAMMAVCVAALVERASNGSHASNPSCPRRDDVGAGGRVGNGGPHELLDRRSFATSLPTMMPQWPWSVYSHRQTSVATSMSAPRA